jgi:hypothetical protein
MAKLNALKGSCVPQVPEEAATCIISWGKNRYLCGAAQVFPWASGLHATNSKRAVSRSRWRSDERGQARAPRATEARSVKGGGQGESSGGGSGKGEAGKLPFSNTRVAPAALVRRATSIPASLVRQLVFNVSRCVEDNGDGLLSVAFPPVTIASGATVPSCTIGVRHPAVATASIRDKWCASPHSGLDRARCVCVCAETELSQTGRKSCQQEKGEPAARLRPVQTAAFLAVYQVQALHLGDITVHLA